MRDIREPRRVADVARIHVDEEPLPTGRSAGSLAWAGLANAYYWIDPARGVGGVYATQILPFADVKAWPLYLDFEKGVYDAL